MIARCRLQSNLCDYEKFSRQPAAESVRNMFRNKTKQCCCRRRHRPSSLLSRVLQTTI